MKEKRKSSVISVRIILTSAFLTLLLVATLSCFVLIRYRIESQINVSPVEVLAVSQIQGGSYSYETFGKSGILDIAPFRQAVATLNSIQALIPPSVRMFISSVTGCVSAVTGG